MLQRLGSRVHIRPYVGDVRAGVGGELPRVVDRRAGQVDAGHPGAKAVQTQRVRTDVALQVDGVEAGDVPQPGAVEPYDVAERVGVGQVPLNPVRPRVQRRSAVPVGRVDREIVVIHGPEPSG